MRLLLDLRQALRGLRRTPGFTVLAILCLGLGLGATVAVFTVVKQVLLDPLGYPDADRLVILRSAVPKYTSAPSTLNLRVSASASVQPARRRLEGIAGYVERRQQRGWAFAGAPFGWQPERPGRRCGCLT